MKKTLLSFFACLLLINGAYAALYTATEDLKIKTGRGVHAEVIGMMKRGDTIDVYEGNEAWSKVKYDGKEGFIKTKYLKIAPVLDEQAEEEAGSSLNPYAILFLIVAVTAIGFLWKLFHTGEDFAIRNKRAKNTGNKRAFPIFWYQCKHCKAMVKNGDHPSHTGCLGSREHHWTELAEVGTDKYFCKHCQATIQTKATPMGTGCPEADFHHWTNVSPRGSKLKMPSPKLQVSSPKY